MTVGIPLISLCDGQTLYFSIQHVSYSTLPMIGHN